MRPSLPTTTGTVDLISRSAASQYVPTWHPPPSFSRSTCGLRHTSYKNDRKTRGEAYRALVKERYELFEKSSSVRPYHFFFFILFSLPGKGRRASDVDGLVFASLADAILPIDKSSQAKLDNTPSRKYVPAIVDRGRIGRRRSRRTPSRLDTKRRLGYNYFPR